MSTEASSPPPEQSSDPAEQQAYPGAFGPAELVQYTPDDDGITQLAELYEEPGTQIEWQDTDPNRRVLIAGTDNNTYYLRGNHLYDIGASARDGELVGEKTGKGSTLAMTIGEPVTLFGENPKTVTVRSVLVAGKELEASQVVALGDLLEQKATKKHENPFRAMDNTFEELRSKTATEKKAKQQEIADEKDQEERQRKADEYQEIQAQRAAVQLAREKLQLARAEQQAEQDEQRNQRTPPPLYTGHSGLKPEDVGIFPTQHTWRRSSHRGGQTTNLPPGSSYDQFDAKPGPVSREGIDISPRPRIAPYKYNNAERQHIATLYKITREEQLADDKSDEEATQAAQAAVRNYQQSLQDKKLAEAEARRTKPYEPRQPGQGRTDLHNALEHNIHAVKSLFQRKKRNKH